MVSMLAVTATAGYICRVNVSTAGVLLMKEYSLTQVEMGRVFSAFLVGYALCQAPAGALADRWGARRVLAAASWLWVGLTVVQAFIGLAPLPTSATAVLTGLVVIRFLLGIAAAPTYPASGRGVSRWTPPLLQGRANGLVIGSVGLGSALAPPLVSSVMVEWGWRAALAVSAVPALAVAIAWRFVSDPPDARRSDEPLPANSAMDRSPQPAPPGRRAFVLLTMSYALQGYVGYIFVSWFYLYLVQERHFGLLTGAWVSSLPWVLSIVSIPLGGLISDRLASGALGPVWGRRIVAMVGMAGSGVLISLGAHTESAIVAAVSLAFATALVLCVEGPFWATMMRLAGPRSGSAGGIMNTGCNLAGLLSPALTPLIASYVGWEMALHLAAALSVVAALLWFGIGFPTAQPRS
ncbi:MAG TPA: MFS transporter [Vicinamibacterales bacterium]|jgi:ACS family glucarate transporter-like MFS transporter